VSSNGRSWDHQVYKLAPDEVDRNDRFGVACATGKCAALPTHATAWNYITGRAGRVSNMRRGVCAGHAEAFARRHDLPIGDPPPRPVQPGLLATGPEDDAATSVRVHRAAGRQWYLRQRTSRAGLPGTYSRPLSGIDATAALEEAIAEAETQLAFRQRVVPDGPWHLGDSEASVEVIPANRHEHWSGRAWQLTVACDSDGMWRLTRSLDDRFAPITSQLGNHNMTLNRALAVATGELAGEHWLVDPGGWTTSDEGIARRGAWHPAQARRRPGNPAEPDPQPGPALAGTPTAALTPPTAPFRLIVTGPPSWTDAGLVERSLAAVVARHLEGVVIIHATSTGAVTAIADAYATRTPSLTVEQPEEMADLGADGCVAFHHANTPETDLTRAARQRGIPVWLRQTGSRRVAVRSGRPTPRGKAAGR
jgi:hypothetical protein